MNYSVRILSLITFIVLFTLVFAVSGVITYRIMRKTKNISDDSNRENEKNNKNGGKQ